MFDNLILSSTQFLNHHSKKSSFTNLLQQLSTNSSIFIGFEAIHLRINTDSADAFLVQIVSRFQFRTAKRLDTHSTTASTKIVKDAQITTNASKFFKSTKSKLHWTSPHIDFLRKSPLQLRSTCF